MTTPSVSQDPLGYSSFNSEEQPPFIKAERLPTVNDQKNAGTQWKFGNLIFETSGAGVWSQIVPPTGGGGGITSIAGSSGGAQAGPAISLVGAGGITTSGAGNTITITAPAASGVQTLSGDTGTATPSSGNIQIATGPNMTSVASGSTVTVSLDADVATVFAGNTGSTNPVGNTLTLTGQGSVLTGAGTPAGTVNIRGDGVTSVITNSGTATAPIFPAVGANQLTFVGASGITTSATGATVTIAGSGLTNTWINVTTSGALLPSTNYYIRGNGLSFTMPTDGASNFGEIMEFFISPNCGSDVAFVVGTAGQQFLGAGIPAAGVATISLSMGSSFKVVFFQAITESHTGWAILSSTGTISHT